MMEADASLTQQPRSTFESFNITHCMPYRLMCCISSVLFWAV